MAEAAKESLLRVVDHVLAGNPSSVAVAMAVVLACSAVLVFVLRLVVRFVRWWRWAKALKAAAAQLPHLRTHWLLGNLPQMPGPVGDEAVEFIIKMVARFPRIYSFFIGPFKTFVICSHPETAKVILRTSEPKSMSDYGPYLFISYWLGNGLLVSKGPTWRRNRKLLTPGFHFDVLKPYMQIYNDAANKLIDKWDRAVSCGQRSTEIYESVSLCTLDIIMRCAFSYKEDIQSIGHSHPYVGSTIALAKLVVHRLLSIYLYPDLFFNLSPSGRSFHKNVNTVHQMAYELISSRKTALQNDTEERKKRYLDFLDILLLARDDEGNGLTDQEIRQEVDTFLFEGHDTTASAVSWFLHTMAKHPEEQAQARREVDDLLRDRDNHDIEWDDLHRLPYLTMCIKESLRMNPPVPMIVRELTQPLELVEGISIPAGSNVSVNILGIHHNPTVWGEDVRKFKPERFAPDNIDKMDSHAFLPFSAGPRNCIGQNFALHEVKVIAAKILHRFELAVDKRYPAEHTLELVLRSKDGIRLLLTPRQ